MPSILHEEVSQFLVIWLNAFVTSLLGGIQLNIRVLTHFKHLGGDANLFPDAVITIQYGIGDFVIFAVEVAYSQSAVNVLTKVRHLICILFNAL